MGAMATGVATQMAGMVFDKVSKEMENNTPPKPCQGPECCQKSSCMNMPGFHCDSFRGPTQCVGSNVMHAHKGKCACLHGSCGQDGRCPPAPVTFPASASAAASAVGAPTGSSAQQPLQMQDGVSVTDFGNKMELPGNTDPRRSLILTPLVGVATGFGLMVAAALAVRDLLGYRPCPESSRVSVARDEERLVGGSPWHLET